MGGTDDARWAAMTTTIREFDSGTPPLSNRVPGGGRFPGGVNGALQSSMLRHRHFLLMAENGVIREMAAPIREARKSLLATIARTAERHDALGNLGLMMDQRRRFLFARVNEINDLARVDSTAVLRQRLTELAQKEQEIVANALRRDIPNAVTLDLVGPDLGRLRALVEQPLGGARFADRFVSNFGEMSKQMRTSLGTSFVLGEGMDAAARRLRSINESLGINRAATIARSEIQRVANQTAMDLYQRNADVLAGMQWIGTLDERTCPICGQLDGTFYEINSPPPFPPPAHPGCWTPDHEIFTARGWRPIGEVRDGDRLWTLSPETRRMELDVVADAWRREHHGDVVHVSTRTVDLMLTPDHRMPYVSSWHYKHSGQRSLDLRAVTELADSDVLPRIPSEWRGPEPESIRFAGRDWVTRDLMAFMGWYLTEGSVCRHSNHNGTWQVSIAQHDEANRAEIRRLCHRIFARVWEGEGATMVPLRESDDAQLLLLLVGLGKSHEKFIPTELLRFGREALRHLFDAMIAGDGSRRTSSWNAAEGEGWSFRDELSFYTSSRALADGFTELALKLGYRPGFALREPATVYDRRQGRSYTSARSTTTVSLGRQPWWRWKHRHAGRVHYHGEVVGLTMSRNPIVLVRRNGKTAWTGNCRCYLSPVTRSWEEIGIPREELPATTRASMDGQVPATINYVEWFGMQGPGFQRMILGPTRYELWRTGAVKFSDFADVKSARVVRVGDLPQLDLMP